MTMQKQAFHQSINSQLVSRLFSSRIQNELMIHGRSRSALQYIKESNILSEVSLQLPLRDFFDSAYCYLKRNYRNEYVYKNVLAQKIVLGIHSLTTSTMLSELRAGTSKADVVVLNGTSTVYEIKSELDSFARLASQIASYQKVFDKVVVITSEERIAELKTLVPPSVGIDVLTKRYQIHTERGPVSSPEKLDQAMIFDTLRKEEYREILTKHFGSIPAVPNGRAYSVYKRLFCQLSPSVAHDEMVRILKRRTDAQLLSMYKAQLPTSLLASLFLIKFTQTQMRNFIAVLDREAEVALT